MPPNLPHLSITRSAGRVRISYGSGQKGRVAKALRASISKVATISELPEPTQAMARQLMETVRVSVMGADTTPPAPEPASDAGKVAVKAKVSRKPK